jgi:hypothetical protein
VDADERLRLDYDLTTRNSQISISVLCRARELERRLGLPTAAGTAGAMIGVACGAAVLIHRRSDS